MPWSPTAQMSISDDGHTELRGFPCGNGFCEHQLDCRCRTPMRRTDRPGRSPAGPVARAGVAKGGPVTGGGVPGPAAATVPAACARAAAATLSAAGAYGPDPAGPASAPPAPPCPASAPALPDAPPVPVPPPLLPQPASEASASETRSPPRSPEPPRPPHRAGRICTVVQPVTSLHSPVPWWNGWGRCCGKSWAIAVAVSAMPDPTALLFSPVAYHDAAMSPRPYVGPLLVTVAYVVIYYLLVANQLRVKRRLKREYQARGEKFDRYFNTDRELLAADRYVGNMLEHMPPFLALLWLGRALPFRSARRHPRRRRIRRLPGRLPIPDRRAARSRRPDTHPVRHRRRLRPALLLSWCASSWWW